MNEIKRRKKEAQYTLWISKIINDEVTNSNISYTTVVDAKLSNDGSNLKVFVSFNSNEKKSIEALNSTKGFIRTQLSKYDTGRKVPNITFLIDEVSKNTMNIERILEQIKNEKK